MTSVLQGWTGAAYLPSPLGGRAVGFVCNGVVMGENALARLRMRRKWMEGGTSSVGWGEGAV